MLNANRFSGKKTPQHVAGASKVQQARHVKPKILLVEDDPLIQHIHMRFLELMNCEVIIANNGQQAIDFFAEKPALVLLDIGLPGMSGIEVCRILRHEEGEQRTPIIALTAFGDIIEFECRAAGVDDFAVKPITSSELYNLLNRWLPHYHDTLKPIN